MTASVLRYLLFSCFTVVTVMIGRFTTDEALGLGLVWPLYGVAVLWVASGRGRGRILDTVGLAALTGVTIYLEDGDVPRALVSMLLVVLVPWTWLLVARWLQPDRPGLARPQTLFDLVVVLAASGVGALVAAVLRTWGMWLLPTYDLETFLLLLIRNYSGILGPVSVGVLLLPYVAPAWRGELRRALGTRTRPPVRWAPELVLMLAAAVWLCTLVFSEVPQPLAFTLVLVVVWAAFRIPPVAAVGLALVLGTLGVIATFAGAGQFQVLGSAPFESAAIAQAFLITLVLAALAISIDVEQRRTATERARSAEQVAESRATLFSTVVEHLDEGVTVITSDDDYTLRNRAARRLTGHGGFLEPDEGDAAQPQMVDDEGVPIPRSQMPHSRARAESRVVRETVRLRLPSGGGAPPRDLLDPAPVAGRRRPAGGRQHAPRRHGRPRGARPTRGVRRRRGPRPEEPAHRDPWLDREPPGGADRRRPAGRAGHALDGEPGC